MRALNRKLWREVGGMRGSMISIALVVGAGVMSVITMQSTFRSLERSRDTYYREYRFADVFASLERAPESLARRIEEIPGVAGVRTRVVLDVVLRVPGLDQAATGHLVSVPAERRGMLNDLYLRAGRWVAPGRDDEVLASERFVAVNGLAIGDTLRAVVNGRQRALRIVGIALSPEFVYEVAPVGSFFSDERLFGVLWMEREALAAASDRTGAFNDVALRLAPGASEHAVIDRVDAILDGWGGLGAYPRADQLSNRLLSDEIAQNRATAMVIPGVFLGVAAFLLHIVLLRLVATQRGPIGLLKAFGYEDRTVALHYLGLAFVPVVAGALIGMGAGFWLGAAYTELYGQYFRFPSLEYRADLAGALGAAGISAAAALAGAWTAVRRTVVLQPAEAMQPEAPERFRPLILERIGLHRFLSSAQRMVLRNVERRPVRTLFSALGVGFALAVLLIGLLMLESMNVLIELQFRRIQREDLAVAFIADRPVDAARELARVPGVALAEPYHAVPVELAAGHRSRRTAITGVQPGGTLRRMVDAKGRAHPLPEGGVVLTERLARSLEVAPGDTLRATLLDCDAERMVEVAALMDEPIGINAYMSLPALSELLREEPRASGAYLALARGAEASVFERLADVPAIASTTSKTAMLRSFDDQMAESLRISLTILLGLASVLAVGVIYNGARIALSERGRELASLRVLGFTRGEVAAMLLGEQALVTAIGLPLGTLIGVGLTVLIIQTYDTDLYRIPLALEAKPFLWAAAMIVFVAAAAGLLVRRQLDRADLIAVLKTRE